MATPTEAEVQTQISNLIAIFQELRKHGNVNSSGNISNYIAREDTYVQSLEGDFIPEALSGLSQFRAGINSSLSRDVCRAALDPLLRQYAKVVGTITETDPEGILDRLYDHFVTNSSTVNSRNITHGSPSAGSNIGGGTINRLTVDENNYELEAIPVEAMRADCIRDEHLGAVEHEEVFEFRGQDAEKDNVAITGSGSRIEVRALSARNSLLSNASFSQFSGTIASPTAITNWTVGSDIANFQLDETNYYRDFQGDSTPRALIFETNESISQNFNIRRLQLDYNTPYYCQVAYNRQVGSCDGRLTLTCGNQTADVVLSAQTGWNVLRIAVGQGNWPKNFVDVENPVIKLQLTGRTSGTLLIDDVIFAPYTPWLGTYYAIVGTATPFLYGDSFTWTDSFAGSDSILQYWFWRLYNFFFPHDNASGETWADPSV